MNGTTIEAAQDFTATTMIGAKTKHSPDTFHHFSNIHIPAKFLKEVSLGRKFTTIDAYYCIAELTKHFGLMGIGFGVSNVQYNFEGNNCGCKATFWFIDPVTGERGEIHDVVGDAQVIKNNKAEACKKSYTNFISKCSSYLGLGLKIYLGLGMDDPYCDREAEAAKPKVNLSTPRPDVEPGKLGTIPVPNFKTKAGKDFWRYTKKHTLSSYTRETTNNDPARNWPNNLISEIGMFGHKLGAGFVFAAADYIKMHSPKHEADVLKAIKSNNQLGEECLKAYWATVGETEVRGVSFDDDDIPF